MRLSPQSTVGALRGNRMNFGELSTRTASGTSFRHSARSARAGAVLAAVFVTRRVRGRLGTIPRGLSIRAAEAFGSTKGTAAPTAENACRLRTRDVSFEMADPETLESK